MTQYDQRDDDRAPPAPPIGDDPCDYVAGLLTFARSGGISDVYLVPLKTHIEVRAKRCGAYGHIARLDPEFGAQCIARMKVLASLLTYRTNLAQDGLIQTETRDNDTEMRLSIMPTRYGERAALRVLTHPRATLRLDALNFNAPTLTRLRQLLSRRSGLVILTGPTGSGKTTTIYAMVRELLDMGEDPAAIVTIEDPIEATLEGVSQTQVSVGNNWNYATGLRAALRQDVKTLVVGEMRDADVVRVTMDAALTGHRVITTYHAGDIASVYARLLHQGFEPFLVASAVTGVIAQRLFPSDDAATMVPVVTSLIPDDAWRDLVASAPGLSALRQALRSRPQADFEAAATELHSRGILSETVVQALRAECR